MEKVIDLHMHSTYSDGQYNPNELIQMIKDNNINVFSLTDHDNIDGNRVVVESLKDSDITFITGIEMSAYIEEGQLHILGYGFDLNNIELVEALKSKRQHSINRIKHMINYLESDCKITFKKEELDLLYNPLGDVGRPEIAKLLIKHGYAATVKDAFNKYLNAAYDAVRDITFSYKDYEAINLIKNAGGIPVLAHPILTKLDFNELEVFLKHLKSIGLMGIEVYHSDQDELYRLKLLELANKYELLVSGGSDFHGPLVVPNVSLGSGHNNLKITELSIVNYIKNR